MFTHDLCGNALRNLTESTTIERQPKLRVRVHVEESWCHYFASRIDRAFGSYGGASDIDDSVALDGNIGKDTRTSRAVDYMTTLDKNIRFFRRWTLGNGL